MSEQGFERWWDGAKSLIPFDGLGGHRRIAQAAWKEACRLSAKAAWDAETHHDAVEDINTIAGEVMYEP